MKLQNVLKSAVVIAALVLQPLRMSADDYDFVYNGLYYQIISMVDRTCCLVTGEEVYAGKIVVPETVFYNTNGKDVAFTVKKSILQVIHTI